jgi:hypothetical protein
VVEVRHDFDHLLAGRTHLDGHLNKETQSHFNLPQSTHFNLLLSGQISPIKVSYNRTCDRPIKLVIIEIVLLKLKQYNNRFSPTISCCIIYIGVRDRGQEGKLPAPPPKKKIGKPWKFGQMLGKMKKIWANISQNTLNFGHFIPIFDNLGKYQAHTLMKLI